MSATDAPIENWLGRDRGLDRRAAFHDRRLGKPGVHGHCSGGHGARVLRCIAGQDRAIGAADLCADLGCRRLALYASSLTPGAQTGTPPTISVWAGFLAIRSWARCFRHACRLSASLSASSCCRLPWVGMLVRWGPLCWGSPKPYRAGTDRAFPAGGLVIMTYASIMTLLLGRGAATRCAVQHG